MSKSVALAPVGRPNRSAEANCNGAGIRRAYDCGGLMRTGSIKGEPRPRARHSAAFRCSEATPKAQLLSTTAVVAHASGGKKGGEPPRVNADLGRRGGGEGV